MATKKLTPSTSVTKYLSAVTEGKAHGKNVSVAIAQIRDGGISADGSKLVMRYKAYINNKPSAHLIKSWQGAYQVHQIVLAGDASKLFTKSLDIKKEFVDVIGSDKMRETFDYLCPIGLYNNNPEAKKMVNIAVSKGTNPKKENVWEQFLTFDK
jgi:hypothetical protein